MRNPQQSRVRRTLLRRPLEVVRADLRAYLLLNAGVYGLVIGGFVTGLVFPELTAARVTALEDNGTADLVRSLLGSPWLFALTILVVNTVSIGLLTILLPSLVVPFAGILVFAVWAATTGVALVPTSQIGWVAFIPHSLTVLIEFQAYILLVFGAFLIGRSWVWPRSVDAVTRRQGYVRGLQRFGLVAIPAFALLVVGAVYEAFSLSALVPLLLRAFGLA